MFDKKFKYYFVKLPIKLWQWQHSDRFRSYFHLWSTRNHSFPNQDPTCFWSSILNSIYIQPTKPHGQYNYCNHQKHHASKTSADNLQFLQRLVFSWVTRPKIDNLLGVTFWKMRLWSFRRLFCNFPVCLYTGTRNSLLYP